MAALRTLVAKDLRERLRDKSFFLLGILTPLVLAFVLDLVFGDLGEGELEVRLGVVDADQSDISGQLLSSITDLDGQGGFEVERVDPDAPVDAVVEDGDLDAVIVIPAGFSADVTQPAGQPPQLRIVQDPDRPVQAGVAESVVDGVVADIERMRLLNAAAAQLGADPDALRPAPGVNIAQETPGGTSLDPGARMMAGMAVMFVFFTVQFGVITLLSEKETGTMTRLLAAPIPREAILAAKGLVSYVLGVLATMILLGAATLLTGASWGSWLGAFVLVLAAVLTAVALMSIVAGVAKTSEGAGGVQAIIAVGLAMLGGSWFPVSGEGVLGALARLTPHFWFLDGLEELAGGASWGVVGTHVAAMVAIAVVAGVPATILLRRRLGRV